MGPTIAESVLWITDWALMVFLKKTLRIRMGSQAVRVYKRTVQLILKFTREKIKIRSGGQEEKKRRTRVSPPSRNICSILDVSSGVDMLELGCLVFFVAVFLYLWWDTMGAERSAVRCL